MVDGADVMPGVLRDAGPDGGLRRATCARAGSPGRAAASPTSSTSASAARTSGRRWRRWRSRPTTTGRAATSSRTSTGRTSPTPCAGLDPATTLVIVASKTFTTIETMTNAAHRQRLDGRDGGDSRRRSSRRSRPQLDRTAAFGIDPARVFGFEDWVGGRYSMWGPIGLSLMIAIGPEAFRALLRGAQAMDRHFRVAEPLREHAGHAGARRHLAQPGLRLRHPRRAALRPAAGAAAGLPPAARDGVERQARLDGRRRPDRRQRPRGLGRARHQRPARLLPAHPPGHPRRSPASSWSPPRATSPTSPTSTGCSSPTASPSPRR